MQTDQISQCVCIKCRYIMKFADGGICPDCPKCHSKMIVGSNIVEQLK